MLKCIAIDDEPVALDIIIRFCKRMEDLEVKGFTNPLAAIEETRHSHPDIVFLDIEMGDISGLTIAKELPSDVFLVFTTAYANYALEGFELNAVDFLHKPFSFARFEKAVEKVRKLKNLQSPHNGPAQLKESILLKSEHKNVRIPLSAILYIEAMDNYVRIYLADNSMVLSQIPMKQLLQMLPEKYFVRVHKSYIVPLQRIAEYTRQKIRIYPLHKEIPVGRTYAGPFLEKMKKNALQE